MTTGMTGLPRSLAEKGGVFLGSVHVVGADFDRHLADYVGLLATKAVAQEDDVRTLDLVCLFVVDVTSLHAAVDDVHQRFGGPVDDGVEDLATAHPQPSTGDVLSAVGDEDLVVPLDELVNLGFDGVHCSYLW